MIVCIDCHIQAGHELRQQSQLQKSESNHSCTRVTVSAPEDCRGVMSVPLLVPKARITGCTFHPKARSLKLLIWATIKENGHNKPQGRRQNCPSPVRHDAEYQSTGYQPTESTVSSENFFARSVESVVTRRTCTGIPQPHHYNGRIRGAATLWPSHRLRVEAIPSPKPPYDTHPLIRALRRKEAIRRSGCANGHLHMSVSVRRRKKTGSGSGWV